MEMLLEVSLFCFCLFLPTQPSESAKIVGYPMFGGSQYLGIKRIAEELVSRGHEVTILVSNTQRFKPVKGITHEVYQVPYTQDFMEKEYVVNAMKSGVLKELFSGDNTSIPEVERIFCEALLNDTKLLEPLKKFDLIITDCTMLCGPLLAAYLGIKRIEYCPLSLRFISPMTPYESLFTVSYVPIPLSGNTAKMNVFQRTKNTLVYIVLHLLMRCILTSSLERLKEKYHIKPESSLAELIEDNELRLFIADFPLEYAVPILPSYKLIGPLNIQPVKPLPPDLQQLIDSSGDDGFIIVSFGSNLASKLDKDKVDIMAEAFGRLKQKVIWRLQGYIPSSLSANIKPVEWLPQNDLLAHPKIRVYVSHVGQNSLYEAAYHGVPVVALPLFADQPDNALLLVDRGLGLMLDFHSLTADEMYNTIQWVIQDSSFKENAQRISGLLSDRPRSPAQEAADWIEYTLRHGSVAHLRPYSSQLAWYQYFLVDVALFLVLIVLGVVLLIKYTVRFVCWLCCQSGNKKVKTQ